MKGNDKICCDTRDFRIPGKYGCNIKSYKQKYKFRKQNFQKYKKRFNRENYKKRYFRWKNYKPSEKRNYCPSGKKKCRCWICNEEGHYANECPRRLQHKKEFPQKSKIL